jgi:hypothetical protein
MPQFRILPGLPATGPRAFAFPPRSKAEFSEGFVVQFIPEDGAAWTGNFAEGPFRDLLSSVHNHPDGKRVIVQARGMVWAIDPNTPETAELLNNWTSFVLEAPEFKRVILGTLVSFMGIGPDGPQWKSKRISWDGFQSLAIEGHYLKGESWTPIDQKWVPFRLNLLTGEHEGGAYTLGDT